MATLALAAAGSAIGGALLPAGFSVLGATLTGAAIGSQIGALAGSYVDNALFGSSGQSRAVDGPRLSDLHVTTSTEGAHIPRVYGRVRLGGQLIWATDIEEEVVTSTQSSGSGKGLPGSGGGAQTDVTEYHYFGNFAVALCEGPVTRIGRVWADGRELDLSHITWRLHHGSQTQAVDSLIAAREGAGNAPAYRGVAYVAFEHLALAGFGNRVPQLSFEVYRSIAGGDANIKGVVLIPGSGEFVYATEPVSHTVGVGASGAENVHTQAGPTDWSVAIDQLETDLPTAKSVSLVVSWFGTDLRAGVCEIKPGVEFGAKVTQPLSWSVAGVARSAAYVVSRKDGKPAYGGTPSDQTVVSAIRDLKGRGFNVTFTPFILMDVAQGNTLPNPYGGTGQAAYPWRGRITCSPAPGVSGSPDKTAAAAASIASFVGTAVPAHFSIVGDVVSYSGPVEWSYRRMVLHQAHLAKAAGGVEAFVIGTELRGLTQVRSSASAYPFVSALVALAADVKSVLGTATKIVYAADWSEYFGHQPGDGTRDVYFHLDPLWASASIDAIGIDVYWPLSDWREGRSHLDYQAGYRSIYDLNYLKSNVQGGEGYDWYYASGAARDAQVRSPINDSLGKPWLYRYKDIKSWWLNQHFNRPGGNESASPTAWVPQSKPFWLMEIGCPAVDKGANEPNVFVDPKSAESALPYYSRGTRDDLMQRRFLRAFVEAFDWTSPGYVAGLNPVSSVNGARMVNTNHIHVYCWDARPFPAFPYATDVWGDGANWHLGHWINGRLASAPLAELVAKILTDFDFQNYDSTALNGTVPGYIIDRVMSARDALQPLELGYFFDSFESEGRIVFRHRGQEPSVLTVSRDNLVETRSGSDLLTLTRGQETDLPASAKIRFISGEDDYRQAVAEARRLRGASGRVGQADLAIVLDDALAANIAETWLFETWAARERASFKLPPSALAIEPGDMITITGGDKDRFVRVTEIGDHGVRDVDARGIDPDVHGRVGAPVRAPRVKPAVQIGQPAVAFLDLPLLTGNEAPETGYIAATQSPWPGGVSIYASPQTSGYQFKGLAAASATLGTTLTALRSGPEGRVDRGSTVRINVSSGMLTSASLLQVLAGVNTAAIQNGNGDWEVLQFLDAVLVDVATYDLSGLLRGQAGTETAMRPSVLPGATFVLLNSAIAGIPLALSELKLPFNWLCGPSNRAIGDPSYVSTQHAFQGLGQRPLSPVRIKGARLVGGDLSISWLRRTRIGGDSWTLPDVPLAEDFERYELDVMAGAIVKRTIVSTTTAALYTSAQQVADFGSQQASVNVRIQQMSALYGRGAARDATL